MILLINIFTPDEDFLEKCFIDFFIDSFSWICKKINFHTKILHIVIYNTNYKTSKPFLKEKKKKISKQTHLPTYIPTYIDKAKLREEVLSFSKNIVLRIIRAKNNKTCGRMLKNPVNHPVNERTKSDYVTRRRRTLRSRMMVLNKSVYRASSGNWTTSKQWQWTYTYSVRVVRQFERRCLSRGPRGVGTRFHNMATKAVVHPDETRSQVV